MGDMKSAWEKALERAEELGKPSDEELKRLEYAPLGNRLAARYLEEGDFDLDAELNKYKDSGVTKYIVRGIEEVFLRNVVLPRDELTKKTVKRAMAGIRIVKENRKQLEVVFDRINNLVNYYEQAYQQTYMQFKKGFEDRLQEAAKAMQQHLGPKIPTEAELQIQFQEEWRRISNQLNAQYEKPLEEHKQQIIELA